MSDAWTFDQPEPEAAPPKEETVAIPGDPSTGRATRIFPAPVQESQTDEDPEQVIPDAEYAANFGRLLRPRKIPPHTPPPGPPPPPPPLGHNQGPPMGGGPPLTPEEARAAVLDTIAPAPKTKEPLDIYTRLIDDLHPVKRAMGDEYGDIAAIDNPYEQFRLSRGAPGRAEHMLRHGTIKFDDLSNVGESFEDIMRPITQAGERDAFVSYLKSRHALEMEQHGVASGVPLDAARIDVAHNAARYEPYAQGLDDYQANVLNYMKDSGILSQEAVDAMRNKWTSYIPMYRAFDGGPHTPKEFNVQNPVRRRTGSEEKTLDPVESIIRNTYTMTQNAENNRGARTFVDYFQARPGQIPLQKVKQPVIPKHVHADETRRALEDAGIDTSGIPDSAMPGFDIFRHARQQSLRPGEIAVYRNGKREVWKTDPAIAEAITKMNDVELGMFTKIMGAGSRTLRAGVVLNPAYMLRNIHRDQLTAFVQSKHNYIPYWDFLSGMKSRVTKDQAYQNALKSGGMQATMVAQDRKYDNALLRKYGAKPRNLLEKARSFRPLEGLRELSEAFDNATRLGEYKRTAGMSNDPVDIMEGGMAMRDVTQDFQRKGKNTQAYRHSVAFGGGQLQGIDRELSNLKHGLIKGDARSRTAVAAKIASGITIPSIILWYMNKDDPRFQNENNQVKDRYWLKYPPYDPSKPLSEQEEPIRITKGFSTGIAFSAPTERFLDKVYRDRPEAFKDLAASLAESAIPGFVPTLLQPAAEHLTNKTAMSKFQRPLIPRRFEGKIYHDEQYHPGTSEVAKLAGKGVAKVAGDTSFANPIVIDNYIRGHGGDVAKYATHAADAALRAAGLTPSHGGEKPEKKWSDVPGVGSFVQRFPSGGMQPIQDFYEKYTELEKAHNTRKKLTKQDRDAEAEAIPDLGRLSKVKRRVDNLQRQLRDIQDDKSLNAKQKRQQIDETYIELLEASQDGLEQLKGRTP